MRRALLSLVALAWPASSVAAAVTTHDVAIRDDAYDPATITIGVGDSVRWTNRGLKQHSVTFRSGTDYTLLPTEDTTQAFPHAGTYRYFCTFHEETMRGTVLVRGTSGSTNRSTTTTTEPPSGSARTGPTDTSTTTTSSSTTTSVVDDGGSTTTTVSGGTASGLPSPGGDDDADVDGAAAVAALLLLAAGGAAFVTTRTSLP